MQYVDIHSHILPGLDDGARDEAESLKMFRLAERSGISDIIATPHFHYRRGMISPEEIENAANRMQKLLDESNIKINIHTGNELYYSHELIRAVKAGDVLTLAGSNYVLLEFSPNVEKRKLQSAVYQFLGEGYFPIIAHMERYSVLQSDPEIALDIYEMGALYQMNAGSLLGRAGWKTKRFSRLMMENGLVQFIATDAHDSKRRSPDLQKAAKWIAGKHGRTNLKMYLQENPAMILDTKQ